jgi:hypothetical protein
MGSYKAFHLMSLLVFLFSFSVFGQWYPVSSGTTNNLNGAYLLACERPGSRRQKTRLD